VSRGGEEEEGEGGAGKGGGEACGHARRELMTDAVVLMREQQDQHLPFV